MEELELVSEELAYIYDHNEELDIIEFDDLSSTDLYRVIKNRFIIYNKNEDDDLYYHIDFITIKKNEMVFICNDDAVVGVEESYVKYQANGEFCNNLMKLMINDKFWKSCDFINYCATNTRQFFIKRCLRDKDIDSYEYALAIQTFLKSYLLEKYNLVTDMRFIDYIFDSPNKMKVYKEIHEYAGIPISQKRKFIKEFSDIDIICQS